MGAEAVVFPIHQLLDIGSLALDLADDDGASGEITEALTALAEQAGESAEAVEDGKKVGDAEEIANEDLAGL